MSEERDINEVVIEIFQNHSRELGEIEKRHQEELEKVKKDVEQEAYERGRREQELESRRKMRDLQSQSSSDEQLRKALGEIGKLKEKLKHYQTLLLAQDKRMTMVKEEKKELLSIIDSLRYKSETSDPLLSPSAPFEPALTRTSSFPRVKPERPPPRRNYRSSPEIEESEGEDENVKSHSQYFKNPIPDEVDYLPSPSHTSLETTDARRFLVGSDHLNVAVKDFKKKSSYYPMVDLHVASLHGRRPETISEMVRVLLTSITSQEAKVRAIYVFLVRNFRYRMFEAGNGPYEADEVYKAGYTKCGGFANLFAEMCLLGGIECRIVKGLTKDVTDIPGRVYSGTTNHAWNLVKIDNRWFHVDASHGSCRSSDKDNKNFTHLDDHYYLVDPNQLIFDHWSKEYQFRDIEMTKKEWEEMVVVDPFGFKRGLRGLSQKKAVVVIKEGNNWVLKFNIALGNFVKPTIFHENVESERKRVLQELSSNSHYYCDIVDGEATLYFSFPKGKTSYTVRIMIGPKSREEPNMYQSVMKYRVVIVKEVEKEFHYPTTVYSIAQTNDCQLLSGGCKEVKRGEENYFRCKLPYCKDAFIQVKGGPKGKEQSEMYHIGDGIFERKVFVPLYAREVVIYGKWGDNGLNYSGLYSFKSFAK